MRKKEKKVTVRFTPEQEKRLILSHSLTEQIFKNLQGKYTLRTPAGHQIKADFDRIYTEEEIAPFAMEIMGCIFVNNLIRQVNNDLCSYSLTLKGTIEDIILPLLRDTEPEFKELSDKEAIERFKKESIEDAVKSEILKPVEGGYRITGEVFNYYLDEITLVRAFRRLPF